MALAFETGQTTGQLDLLAKLADFITNDAPASWTVQSLGSVGAISGFPLDQQLSIRMNNTGSAPAGNRKGYLHLISQLSDANPRMYFAPSTAYTDASTAWHSQSGGLGGTGWQGISIPKTASSPPMNYWFHCDINYLWVTVGIDGGWFQHLFFGSILAKNPAIITGEFQGLYCAGTIQFGQRNNTNHNYNVMTGGLIPPAQGLGLLQGIETPVGCLGRKAGGGASQPATGSARIRNTESEWLYVGHYDRLITVAPAGEAYRTFDIVDDGSSFIYSRAAVPASIPAQFDANIVTAMRRSWVSVKHPDKAGKFQDFGPIPGAYVTGTQVRAEAETIEIDGDYFIIFPLVRTRRVDHFFMNAGLAIQTVTPP